MEPEQCLQKCTLYKNLNKMKEVFLKDTFFIITRIVTVIDKVIK